MRKKKKVPPSKKVLKSASDTPQKTQKRRFKYWQFLVGLILGLLPFLVTVTPLNNIIHPISVNPSDMSVNPYPYSTIGYFNITNNLNTTLFSVQIELDLPQGLASEDVEIEKLTKTDDTEVDLSGISWNTSMFIISGIKNDGNHMIIVQLDRVLPGEDNILSFSVKIKPSFVTKPISISCVRYEKSPTAIIGK